MRLEGRLHRTGPVEEGRRMADNDRMRGYRDNETFRRPKPSSEPPAGDPLTELARLIGQQNESVPSFRPGRAPAPYDNHPGADQVAAVPDPYESQPNLGAARWASRGDQAAPAPVVYGDSRYDPRRAAAAQQSRPSVQSYSSSGADPSAYDDPRQPETYDAAQYADPRYADQPYAEQSYADPRYAADPHHDDARYSDPRYTQSGYAEPGYAEPAQDDPRYAAAPYADPRYDDGAGQGYSDPRYPDPHFGAASYGTPYAAAPDGYLQSGDQGYSAYAHQHGGMPQGQPQARPQANSYFGAQPSPSGMGRAGGEYGPTKRRGGMVTVLAVLALAVVGTAAAFGYRAMFTGAGAVVPPPVIKADVRPSKVVPATDPNNKPIQDRIGVKTERIVPRQEEPVQQAAPGQPRVIAPFLGAQSPQAFPPASANVSPTSGAQPSGSEPKRIRTVPIKPQQGTEAPARSNGRNAAATATQTDGADQSQAPMALSPTGSVPNRQVARQAHAALSPNDTGNGAASAFPAPLPSSTSSAPASGPFAVQVTSQRSEADAQASFRSLQQQFPSVLGNRQPLIKRADLGDRGTYYRAQIPFSNQNAASEFCSSLKAAGGQCVVARN
jgi:hypothetical protein